MTTLAENFVEMPPDERSRRIEELGRIILAYSEVTEKLQKSHDELTRRTQQLQIELGEKQRQLERKNRLAALGEMAAGIAHEIRNPLGAIRLYVSLLRKDLAGQPPAATVEKIAAASARMEAIVSQVLHYTRDLTVSRERCDLAEVVNAAVESVRAAHSNTTARVEVSASPVFADVDSRLIHQAVVNLLANALDAVGEDGLVRVELKSLGNRVCLTIDDNGPGLADDVIERMFHPFFTTKDHGTGLGLAIVHRIVEGHDGTIEAGRSPLGGARFELKL